MKTNIISSLIVLVAFIIISFFIYDRAYSKAETYYQWQLDTLLAICNEKPDTINIIDTVWQEKIVFQEIHIPTPVQKGDSIYYSDTVRTSDLDFWISDVTGGTIYKRKTGYLLKVPKIIYDTTIIYQNVPQFIEVPKIINNEYKAYLGGVLGLNYYSFNYGRIIKNRYAIGAEIVIHNNNPTAGVKVTYFLKK